MNVSTHEYDHPDIWRPLTCMPEGVHEWRVPGYDELAEEWASIRAALKDRDEPRALRPARVQLPRLPALLFTPPAIGWTEDSG